MIQLIGIAKNVSLEEREKFVIREKNIKEILEKLQEVCNESIIISTCNRTEIYFESEDFSDCIIDRILNVLMWENNFKKYIFHIKEEKVTKHIMELACGFHSKILGEDQILVQVKEAYDKALEINAVCGHLQRLFQEAITCGKKFKSEVKLFEIPVSYPSIAVNKAMKMNIKSYMLVGYGVMGRLAEKYILSHTCTEKLYIVVRDVKSINNTEDERIEVIPFNQKDQFLKKTDCIISCTSAPHAVLKNAELPLQKRYLIFDLAMPRDVEEAISFRKEVEYYDIDSISVIDEENKKLRRERMNNNRFIIERHIENFEKWKKIRELTPCIRKMKNCGEKVTKERVKTFNNKFLTKDNKVLADKLIKSTSDFYINRAIEVLKEEKLKGSDEECLKIIKRIFMID